MISIDISWNTEKNSSFGLLFEVFAKDTALEIITYTNS